MFDSLVIFQERNAKRYKIREMPTLVLVEGSTGKLITTSGKECLSEDLDGDEFPWYPKSFDNIISGSLLRQETLIDSKEALDGKIKGVYFSAHWVRDSFCLPKLVRLEYLSF